jgi:hypothetical protein
MTNFWKISSFDHAYFKPGKSHQKSDLFFGVFQLRGQVTELALAKLAILAA